MYKEKATLVFDIETVPDIAKAKQLYQLDNLTDAEAFEALKNMRRQETGGSDFFRHHLHKIVCISVVLRMGDSIRVWSLGEEDASEAEIIKRFFTAIDKYDVTLVSWNGSGFDLPVLHYRAMLHEITAPMYWELGDHYKEFRYNNYINRFHMRHLDLMDVLSLYQARASQPLDQIASFLGFPGKMGMAGSQVYEQYLAGNIADIRHYCETDVLKYMVDSCPFSVVAWRADESRLSKRNCIAKKSFSDESKTPSPSIFSHMARARSETMNRKQRDRLKQQAPINLEITGLSHDGRGIGHHEGKIVFVSGALTGETVEAKVTLTRSKYDEADTVTVIKSVTDSCNAALRAFWRLWWLLVATY
jgi:predicted PolB exonuclease-like 3'-5' exonuclease/predicted RNA-binding protein with TRAM domain